MLRQPLLCPTRPDRGPRAACMERQGPHMARWPLLCPNCLYPAASCMVQALAGSNKGIVDEMIYLELTRPGCPDLTMIDLPGAQPGASPACAACVRWSSVLPCW